MTSLRKLEANRRNARLSSGPKSAAGRARSAKNAYRFGLSLPIRLDDRYGADINALARQLAGPDASQELFAAAMSVAEAHMQLHRVRTIKLRAGAQGGASARLAENRLDKETTPIPPSAFVAITSSELGSLALLDRYERRALSMRRQAIKKFDDLFHRARRPIPTQRSGCRTCDADEPGIWQNEPNISSQFQRSSQATWPEIAK